MNHRLLGRHDAGVHPPHAYAPIGVSRNASKGTLTVNHCSGSNSVATYAP
jgi:hypothetical protein